MDATQLLPVAVFLIAALVSSGSALNCFQCNVECRNNTQGCSAGNTTTEYDDGSNSTRVSCNNPSQVTGCVSCMKIRTGYRRYIGRGEFEASEIVSRICQKTESPYEADTCDSSGPNWALDIVCYCYSDFCNSAQQHYAFTIPILALILYAMI